MIYVDVVVLRSETAIRANVLQLVVKGVKYFIIKIGFFVFIFIEPFGKDLIRVI